MYVARLVRGLQKQGCQSCICNGFMLSDYFGSKLWTYAVRNVHVHVCVCISTENVCTCTSTHKRFLMPTYTRSVFMDMNVGICLAHSVETKSCFKTDSSQGSQRITRILWRPKIRYLARFAVLAAVSLGKEFPTFRKLCLFLWVNQCKEKSPPCVSDLHK